MTETIVYKICTKCKNPKPATPEYFYREKIAKDGLYSSCKACKDAYSKTPKGRESFLKKTKKWQRTSPKGQDYRRRTQERRNKKYPEKLAAHQAVKNAIDANRMPRASECACLSCGSKASHYHHWSYDPMHRVDVLPLCHKCHMKVHNATDDERQRLETELRLKRSLKL